MLYLKALGAFIINMVVPGAGFIMTGSFLIGIAIQALSASSIILMCWLRWVLTPAGCKTLLTLLILIHIFNALCFILKLLKAQNAWTIKNTCLALIFSVICFGALFLGFETKDQWLGVHINFVPSISMQPTLQPGDLILVGTWVYRHSPPQINDIVIFTLPQRQDFTVKADCALAKPATYP